jgi:hypothetical protein
MWAFASEKVAAQLLLELLDSTGQGRLRDIAFPRRAREIKRLCNRHEITNLVHFHRTGSKSFSSDVHDEVATLNTSTFLSVMSPWREAQAVSRRIAESQSSYFADRNAASMSSMAIRMR